MNQQEYNEYKKTPGYRTRMAEIQRRVQLERYARQPMSEQQKQNISKALKGKTKSEVHRQHISERASQRVGEKNPFYGKHHTSSVCQTLSAQKYKYYQDHPEAREFLSRLASTRKGQKRRPMSAEQREELRKLSLGRRHSEETKQKLHQALLGRFTSAETKAKMGQASGARWADVDWVKKLMASMHTKPNRQETKLSYILRNVCPKQFKYNGDARQGIVLNRMIPDFVNVNGHKQVIEVFGEYWHSSEQEAQRIARYRAIGWDCLVIWQAELQDRGAVKNKIREFVT